MSLAPLEIRWIEKEITYTGRELRPHYILSEFRLQGHSLIGFLGPCEVKTEHLVDWEDRLKSDYIRASQMVHFLGEFFGISLREGVFLQRLFVSILKTCLEEMFPRPNSITREGDDLFWFKPGSDRFKLTVSIVTASPLSVLLHTAINVDAAGAPIPAAGLQDLGVNPMKFGTMVLERFSKEWSGIMQACTKVRPVV